MNEWDPDLFFYRFSLSPIGHMRDSRKMDWTILRYTR